MAALLVVAIEPAMPPPRALPCEKIHPFYLPRYFWFTTLAEQPMMGRARPELAAGLRSFPTQTPYILFHFPDEAGGIIVARVLHHARDVEAIERWPATPR
jgi:hypothetical protein